MSLSAETRLISHTGAGAREINHRHSALLTSKRYKGLGSKVKVVVSACNSSVGQVEAVDPQGWSLA